MYSYYYVIYSFVSLCILIFMYVPFWMFYLIVNPNTVNKYINISIQYVNKINYL